MIARLRNEQGITLLETLATALILSFTMISLYIGILYADKQVQRNYHDRVAELLVSGELEWQAYYKANYKDFQLFENRPVTIDGSLMGMMSVSMESTIENPPPFGLLVPFKRLQVKVWWQEPGDAQARSIVIIEDFYN